MALKEKMLLFKRLFAYFNRMLSITRDFEKAMV